ncbi:MAG TPA: hypothetical protein PLD79_01405, partial [Halothiobacillus sp.]
LKRHTGISVQQPEDIFLGFGMIDEGERSAANAMRQFNEDASYPTCHGVEWNGRFLGNFLIGITMPTRVMNTTALFQQIAGGGYPAVIPCGPARKICYTTTRTRLKSTTEFL